MNKCRLEGIPFAGFLLCAEDSLGAYGADTEFMECLPKGTIASDVGLGSERWFCHNGRSCVGVVIKHGRCLGL